MILSDRDILLERANGLAIEPFPLWENIQPASIDLKLEFDFIDETGRRFETEDNLFTLKPHQFLLARTLEYIKIPKHLVGRVEGKSSWGRRGLFVHVSAGYIDPGFEGTITLELYNATNSYLPVRKHQNICQLSLMKLSSPPMRLYGDKNLNSKYQGQIATTSSKLT